MIKIDNISKSFSMQAEEIHVLKNISFDIARGETVSIIGKSGVGKSTLLHIIGAIDQPTTGHVSFDGSDINLMTQKMLAQFRNKHIGFIFQFHHLLNDFTALENIAMPAIVRGETWSKAKKKGEELLELVGLLNRKAHKPGELSGGEQQRIALARAISLEPSVILGDEPTGNLDSQTGKEIFNILSDICKQQNISFIIVTHDEKLAGRTDRCIRIVDGRLGLS